MAGWLSCLPRGRKRNTKEVFTHAGSMTVVTNPELYKSGFCD